MLHGKFFFLLHLHLLEAVCLTNNLQYTPLLIQKESRYTALLIRKEIRYQALKDKVLRFHKNFNESMAIRNRKIVWKHGLCA